MMTTTGEPEAYELALHCLDEGTLRAYLDREDDNHATHGAHLRSCLDCARQLRELRRDAELVSAALGPLGEFDMPSYSSSEYQPSAPIEPPDRPRRWSRGLVAATATVAAGGLLVTPIGQSVAASVLNAFSSKKVVAVDVSNLDMEQVSGVLSGLAETSGEASEPQQLASVADAAARVSFTVAQPEAADLPAGVNHTPSVMFTPKSTMTITFDQSKATNYLQGSKVSVPAGLDRTKLVLEFPDAVGLSYQGSGDKMLIVGSAGAVKAHTEGDLSLLEVRDFLLKVPGMPKSLTNQLGSVDAIGGALPIPVPMQQVSGDETTVDGHDAVEMSSPGIGSGVIWQDGERLVGVAGSYSIDQVKTIAEGVTG